MSASGVSDFRYTHYRTLAKLGLAWQSKAWKAGLSVTTPSLGILGSGQAAYTLWQAGVDANGDGLVDDPQLTTATAEDLDSTYKSSWAVGAGVSRLFGVTRLFASTEWYAPVAKYAVIEVPEGDPSAGRLDQELTFLLGFVFGR